MQRARARPLFWAWGSSSSARGSKSHGEVWLMVETAAEAVRCDGCGTRAVCHGRRAVKVPDVPGDDHSLVLVWRKHIWRCPDRDLDVRLAHRSDRPRFSTAASRSRLKCSGGFESLRIHSATPVRRGLSNLGRGAAQLQASGRGPAQGDQSLPARGPARDDDEEPRRSLDEDELPLPVAQAQRSLLADPLDGFGVGVEAEVGADRAGEPRSVDGDLDVAATLARVVAAVALAGGAVGADGRPEGALDVGRRHQLTSRWQRRGGRGGRSARRRRRLGYLATGDRRGQRDEKQNPAGATTRRADPPLGHGAGANTSLELGDSTPPTTARTTM